MAKFISVLFFLIACFCWFTPPAEGQAQDLSFFRSGEVRVCPASSPEETPPDFSRPQCETVSAGEVDPQGQLIWVRTLVSLEETSGPNGEPLSLYVSGKMASKVYLNGIHMGQNGAPGIDAQGETIGLMDAELFAPHDLFRQGDNEVILLVSSHKGYLHLSRPFHMVGIAPVGLYGREVLARSGPVLVTLGVFLVSGLYFAVMALMGGTRVRFAILSAISFFAAGQLLSESLRNLVTYDYPAHDLRLVAITVFSAAFGLSVALHVFRTFKSRYVVPFVAALGLACAVAAIGIASFDYKALVVMTMPLLASLIATGFWTWQGKSRAFVYFLSLLTFIAAIFVFQALFLDAVFFLLVAFFLLLLFVEQALAYAEEARERRSEEARANRLEQALAEVEERAESKFLDVKSAGKIERVATTDIVHCKGAGGYCELVLTKGRTLLHTATLSEMEDDLPATFLRVHRSHLVNVMFVKSLSRDPAGTGTLALSEGTEVPVSRRIMPKVRQALA